MSSKKKNKKIFNKTEKKETVINIFKTLILTFLPILFKSAFDFWKNNEFKFENKTPFLLFITFVLMDIIAIAGFSYYDYKIRDKDHNNQIKEYKNKIKKDTDIIRKNSNLLNQYKDEIDKYKDELNYKKKNIEEQQLIISKLNTEIEKNKHIIKAKSDKSKSLAFLLVDEIVSGTANSLYQEIKRIKNDEHSEINDWNFLETYCDKICQTLYDYIKKIAKKGDLFSVSIVFKMKQSSNEGYFMPSRVSSDKHRPRIYRNFEPKEKYENYCFSTLLENNSIKHKIYMDKESLEQAFENYDHHYSQYIGIPIYCTGGKKIALIQLVAYEDSLISDSKDLLEELASELFIPISNLVFLVDKIENSMQILNGVPSDSVAHNTKKGLKELVFGGRYGKR